MNLSFDLKLSEKYKSPSQKIRVLTEGWVDNQAYCPNCGNPSINKYANNLPVADFVCSDCKEVVVDNKEHKKIIDLISILF